MVLAGPEVALAAVRAVVWEQGAEEPEDLALARALVAVPVGAVQAWARKVARAAELVRDLVWVPVGPEAAQAQPELDLERAEVVRAVALLLAKAEVVRESGYRLPRYCAARRWAALDCPEPAPSLQSPKKKCARCLRFFLSWEKPARTPIRGWMRLLFNRD